jgi:hypothetical protein
MPKNNKPELQTHTKFNRLTVLSYSHSDIRYRKWYSVKCDCGTEKTVMGSAMVSGNTKSCGCLSKEVKANKRISKNHSEITAIILGYKRHAERRGFKWELNRKDVSILIKQNCFYCDSKPSNIKKTKNSLGDGLVYSGIDRIDNSKDYTKGNAVPCCKVCNYAKSNMSLSEFQEWGIRLGKQAMANQWHNFLMKTDD